MIDMSRFWPLLAVAITGCATVVPMQTASTLGAGQAEIGGQAGYATWCGTFPPSCARTPKDLQMPELRLNGRLGLGPGDVGVSLHGVLMSDRGWEAGGFTDLKVRLASAQLREGLRAIVSAGAGAGLGYLTMDRSVYANYNRYYVATDSALQFDLAIPLYLGLQTEVTEWAFSLRGLERRVSGDPYRLWVPSAGVSAAFFLRKPTRFGVQLSYEAPLALLGFGTFNAGVSVTRQFEL